MDLGFINGICVFDEDTPIELINAIRPTVLVKGGEYSLEEIVGYTEVKSWGGRVEIIPCTPGFSTTEKVNKMRREGLV